MHKVGEITTVIQDHVKRLAIWEDDGLFNTPDIFIISLSLPGIDWDTKGSNGCSSMVLVVMMISMMVIMMMMIYTCVEKMLHEDHVTSAPSSSKVSISTAVWTVI